MSTCPNNEVHSVYLDNELTPPLSLQYEAHLKECEKCQKKLQKLKKLRSIFNDALTYEKSINVSESFERLKLKKRFYQNTKQEAEASPYTKTKWLPLAAAAAFLALIIPFKTERTQSGNMAATITPITRQSSTPVTKKTIVTNGNIEVKHIYPVSNSSFTENDFFVQLDSADVFKPVFQEEVINMRIPFPENANSFIANMPISYSIK